ncbi:MAG: glycosyltransferase family 29 protein [Thermoguttaceae bacterium]|jgi:hypothetical protein
MDIFTRSLMKMISSRTVLHKHRKPLWNDHLHRLIAEIWATGRITPEWLNLLGLLSQSRSEWNERNSDIWLMYAAALRKIGETEKAVPVLEKYVRRFGTVRVEKILPLAAFAEEIGIAAPEIVASADAFRKLDKNRKAGMFAELLRGKTVAVVGNGPSEIGTGRGKKIDTYDKVIRFNNYVTTGYETDYGSRTNIWITSTGQDVCHDRSYDNYELTVIGPNLWHAFLADEERANIFTTLRNTDRAATFDPEPQTELWEALDGCPSYGLVCLWTILRQNLATLTADDIFGFSFLQRIKQTYAEHYFAGESTAERKERSHAHDFVSESEFLERLFRQN